MISGGTPSCAVADAIHKPPPTMTVLLLSAQSARLHAQPLLVASTARSVPAAAQDASRFLPIGISPAFAGMGSRRGTAEISGFARCLGWENTGGQPGRPSM